MYEMKVIGNLVAAPTMQEINMRDGTKAKVCHFRVAVNRGRDSAGNQLTEYVNCTAWRGLADPCSQYLDKGRKVYVNGTPRATVGQGRDGRQFVNMELNVREIEFLSPRAVQAQQDVNTAVAAAQNAPVAAAPQTAQQAVVQPTATAQVMPAATYIPQEFAAINEDCLPF